MLCLYVCICYKWICFSKRCILYSMKWEIVLEEINVIYHVLNIDSIRYSIFCLVYFFRFLKIFVYIFSIKTLYLYSLIIYIILSKNISDRIFFRFPSFFVLHTLELVKDKRRNKIKNKITRKLSSPFQNKSN